MNLSRSTSHRQAGSWCQAHPGECASACSTLRIRSVKTTMSLPQYQACQVGEWSAPLRGADACSRLCVYACLPCVDATCFMLHASFSPPLRGGGEHASCWPPFGRHYSDRWSELCQLSADSRIT